MNTMRIVHAALTLGYGLVLSELLPDPIAFIALYGLMALAAYILMPVWDSVVFWFYDKMLTLMAVEDDNVSI